MINSHSGRHYYPHLFVLIRLSIQMEESNLEPSLRSRIGSRQISGHTCLQKTSIIYIMQNRNNNSNWCYKSLRRDNVNLFMLCCNTAELNFFIRNKKSTSVENKFMCMTEGKVTTNQVLFHQDSSILTSQTQFQKKMSYIWYTPPSVIEVYS